MKSSSIIKVFVILCLLVAVRADALTLEARTAIEDMRSRLSSNAGSADVMAAPPPYIPGKDLQAAMASLRKQFYGIDTEQITLSINASPVAEPTPVTKPVILDEPYVPGNLLSFALLKIRQQRGESGSLVSEKSSESLDEPIPAAVATSNPVSVNSPTSVEVAVPTSPVETTPVPVLVEVSTPLTVTAPVEAASSVAAMNSDDLLEASEKATEAAEPVKAVVKIKKEKSETVKKSAGKKKRQETVEKVTPKSTAEEGKTETSKPEDQEFNEFIRKYDFKMPENYRIIVR